MSFSPCPKPAVRVKAPKPLQRSTRPIARSALRVKRTKQVKRGNAYTRPEWRALAAKVHKRSRGVCETCKRNTVDGDPNHLGYSAFTGWRRLIVPMEWLLDNCRACHTQFHELFGAGKSLPIYTPVAPTPSFPGYTTELFLTEGDA